MGTFIVKTEESVTGTYLVEAEDEKQARERFHEDSGKLDWDHIEQTDYMAYTCEVQSVEALEYPQRPAGFRVGFPLSGAKRSSPESPLLLPIPEWLVEAQADVAHEWALELNELDPEVREAVLEHQAVVTGRPRGALG